MTSIRLRRSTLFLGLILLTWMILTLAGLREPLGPGWPSELVAYAGIALVLAGLVLDRPAPGAEGSEWSWLHSPKLWLICGGTALVAGWWDIALLLVAAGGARTIGRRRTHHSSDWAGAWQREGSLIVAVTILLLLLAAFKEATAPGGPKAHRMELGAYGVLISLAGIAWAGQADGTAAVSQELAGVLMRRRAQLGAFAMVTFLGFLGLAYLVRLPQVASLDHSFVHLIYHGGDRGLRRFMKAVSNAGGEDLALIWLPLIAVGLAVFRRGRSLRFFLAANFGVFGIETIFKTLTFRARPDLTHGSHFDSFPSGHTLSAVILAGTLLLILWPTKSRWGRWLLAAAAITWPVLMGASRIYLGRHYLTDVLGSWLLGTAWVLAGTAILFALDWKARLESIA